MKANKVGQDFNFTGIKYGPGAVDVPAFPRWIPLVFWGSVCAVFLIIAWMVL